MRDLFHPPCFQRIIIQSPADIIVATQVIEECVFLGREHTMSICFEQADVSCGDRMPGRSHRRHIVEHVAFRLLNRAEIRRHLSPVPSQPRQGARCRADDFADHPHHTDDSVNLGQVPAGCPQFLPDIRNCINTDNIHALVCQKNRKLYIISLNTRGFP